MLEALEGYDWAEVFAAAGGGEGTYNPGQPTAVRFGRKVSVAPFVRADVATILAIAEGEHDGPEWVVAGRLNDGRWFVARGGCDYTGWDCQSDASAEVAATKVDLLTFGLTEGERDRLNLVAPPAVEADPPQQESAQTGAPAGEEKQ